jgi:A/G-specific adenine glycosylase
MSGERKALKISGPVLKWFDQHGRKNLPWQHDINPYRVWLSEIMLQQTQVATVIDYFNRFVAELPDLASLAGAHEDTVLHLWTGLGYYSRARNLHQTARIIQHELAGKFPDSIEELCKLPGIGRSTAGAIKSIAFQQRAAILDGNVKRVLARYHAIAGWPGQSQVAKTLWEYAEAHTPSRRNADYSQAMMDLGATLCTRSKPACNDCPLSRGCLARQQQTTAIYPGKKPKKTLPVKHTQMILFENPRGEILLQKRPPTGIWGGLWAFPETGLDTDSEIFCRQFTGAKAAAITAIKSYRHTFSHFHLEISPVHIQLKQSPARIMEDDQQLWYNIQQPQAVGLSAPTKKLLKLIASQQSIKA